MEVRNLVHARYKGLFTFFKRVRLDKEFFACPPDPATVFYAGKIAINCEANSYSIKSLCDFKALLMQEQDDTFRFLVDKTGKLWFANESRPFKNAPKHFQMTGDPLASACCFSAGNIKFKNKKGMVLKSINHRSGDFFPSVLSLRWLLAILLVNEELLPFNLPKSIVIKEIKNEKIYKHRCRLSNVKKWVDGLRHNEALINQLSQKNLSSKIVHYQAIKHLGF